MRVLRIVAEGATTSFRYPHFTMSIHPTFEAPPPATIYGHISSALGECPDPQGLCFAYHFQYEAEAVDLEHIIVAWHSTSKLPGTSVPGALAGAINPFERHILFMPRLVLYVNRPEWVDAFRSPYYAVALGRSQDLFTYTSVDVVDLKADSSAYLEHTLLPHEMGVQTGRGYTVLMPRYLDYALNRRPTFARYVVLHERVQTNSLTMYGDGPAPVYWTDPDSPEVAGNRLGLVFHSFVGEGYESLSLA